MYVEKKCLMKWNELALLFEYLKIASVILKVLHIPYQKKKESVREIIYENAKSIEEYFT